MKLTNNHVDLEERPLETCCASKSRWAGLSGSQPYQAQFKQPWHRKLDWHCSCFSWFFFFFSFFPLTLGNMWKKEMLHWTFISITTCRALFHSYSRLWDIFCDSVMNHLYRKTTRRWSSLQCFKLIFPNDIF